ncbi:MAG TPA: succinate dehydrogenase, hydrophobic membrane anchor protein [Allosphingosinicella sp.]|nr:succinate dehydrogenase, hydrophobic membrane anchor protein [Allosphingosinicella sp.]
MTMETPLAEARGPGAAHAGGHHWGVERATSVATLALLVWLAVSLMRLPSLDQQMVSQWLRAPLAAVPMLLLIVAMFRHLRDGLIMVVEDYVHEEGNRLMCLLLINFAAVFVGALALFSVLRMAFGEAPRTP